MAARALFRLVLTALLLAVAGPVLAESLRPVVPKGKGSQCVADTEFMRRNHMKVLTHNRKDTVRRGVRGGKFSLKRCVTCHAVQGDSGKAVSFKSPKHFCRACHDYAAVRIDCFECHRSTPPNKKTARWRLPPPSVWSLR